MKRLTTCAFIALVSALTNPTAQASSVTYNGTVSPGTLGSTISTTLPMFNASLGTLTDVEVTLDFTATPYAQALNVTGISQVFSPSDWASASFSSANNWTITFGTDSWTLPSPTVATGQFFGTGQTVPSFNILTFVGASSAPVDLTGASGLDFADYTGAGSLAFGTSGIATYSGSGTGFGFGGGANLTGTASVTYDYAPVPEPTALALMGLGGLAFMLRRRQ